MNFIELDRKFVFGAVYWLLRCEWDGRFWCQLTVVVKGPHKAVEKPTTSILQNQTPTFLSGQINETYLCRRTPLYARCFTRFLETCCFLSHVWVTGFEYCGVHNILAIIMKITLEFRSLCKKNIWVLDFVKLYTF